MLNKKNSAERKNICNSNQKGFAERKEVCMLNKKGFIGPIGDDLPSLIPLLIALTIFFATFTFSFNLFQSKNSSFTDDLAVLTIARVLQSNGYITSLEDFRRLCNTLAIPEVNYIAGLTNMRTAPKEYRPMDWKEGDSLSDYLSKFDDSDHKFLDVQFVDFDEDEECIEEGDGTVSCSEIDTEDDVVICKNVDDEILDKGFDYFADKQMITRIFPVVLEQKKVVKPVHLIVFAWK